MPLEGTYTAIVTPTVDRGEVDESAFRALLDWQAESGVDGIVVGGTTGESATLSEAELGRLFETAVDQLPTGVEVIAATGRNHLTGSMSLTGLASDLGIRSVLLVDPYYNGPSSLEIRREYIEPISDRFPSIGIVPYVIPGRTGTRLDPSDVEQLLADHRPIIGLKDATADDEYARELRRRCPDLSILCGDDSRTLHMMRDPTIQASGVISVVSNLAPAAVAAMVQGARGESHGLADRASTSLAPLFESVTLTAAESGVNGQPVSVRSRNPVPVKTALGILGVPVGRCRPPLGRLGPAGLTKLIDALLDVERSDPDVLRPLARHFDVDIEERLTDRSLREEFAYAKW